MRQYPPPPPTKHEALSQCWVNVGPTSTTSAQHWSNNDWMPRVCWVSQHGTITRCYFNFGPVSKAVVQHWNIIPWMACVCWCSGAKYTADPVLGLVLGQHRKQLTGIQSAMGCDAGPSLNRNWVDRPNRVYPSKHKTLGLMFAGYVCRDMRQPHSLAIQVLNRCWPALRELLF